ncbi:uncharacterized protein [Triticum aestivum]|nr:uncharacterized protein LOC123115196 [Triticum aestivum]
MQVSLLRSMRPQPENTRGGDCSALEFAEPRLGPVLLVTREDLEQFDTRDWEEYFRASSAARPFPVEVALVIALAALSLVFAVMATKARKRRRGDAGTPKGLAEADGVLWLARGRVRAEIELTQRMIAGLRQARSDSQEGAAPKIISTKARKRRGGGGGGRGGGTSSGGGGGGLLPLVPRHAGKRNGLAEADAAVWLARVVATGMRGRGRAHIEPTQKMIAGLRQARSKSHSQEGVAPKISNLSSYAQKRVRTVPVNHLAAIPEWKTAASEAEADDYKAATLAKLGTTVCRLNIDIPASDESEKMRKEVVDRCRCAHPGSEDCVRVHVGKARSWIKDQLGEEAFRNCGLDAMGEQVAELWASVDRKKLEDLDKLVPQNKPQKFMETALKELGQKETKDLAKYCYNVFLPRRLASLTRAEHKNDEAVDWEDEKSDQEDDRNDRSPRKKNKTSGSSSSTSCRK